MISKRAKKKRLSNLSRNSRGKHKQIKVKNYDIKREIYPIQWG